MNLFTAATVEGVIEAVAGEIVAMISRGPSNLGLATGRTFTPVYRELARMSRSAFDPAQVSGIQIDEYVGLSPADPRSFAYALGKLVPDLMASSDRILTIDGRALSPEREIARHTASIDAAGGIDLLLLGLGRNGHIAFNEPGSTADSGSRVVSLAAETKRDAAKAFAGSPPAAGVTLGIKELRQARSIYLVATGAAKHDAFSRLGDPDIPATFILDHPGLRVFADKATISGA
jgi:glucosamine-6-phosphate deaminase